MAKDKKHTSIFAKKGKPVAAKIDEESVEIPAVDEGIQAPSESEGIEGPETQRAVAGSMELPGEDSIADGPKATVNMTEGEALASQLYSQCGAAISQREMFGKLSFFQQMTLIGAYALTGQLLGRSDKLGPVTLSRHTSGKDLFDMKLWNASFQQGDIVENSEKTTEISVDGVPPTADNLDLIGIPQARVREITTGEMPSKEVWLAWVYEEIRRVRANVDWVKLIFHKTQLILQGIQITSAQLLGLTDRHGAITLKRYIERGDSDPRVFNALGYWRRK